MKEFSTKKYFSCPFLGKCSGCEMLENLFRPDPWKEILTFFYKIDPTLNIPLYNNGFEGTRFIAKLAVREKEGLKIGLFKKNSHEVMEILNCPAHHCSINEALRVLKKAFLEFRVQPYSEETGSGLVRYVQFSYDKESGKVVLVLVLNSKQDNDLKIIYQLVSSLDKEMWHSIWLNFQTAKSNTIFGSEWLHIWGEKFLWMKLNNVNMAFHPGAFSQSNLLLFEKLLVEIINEGRSAKKILELYSGNGAIGLNLANKNNEVTFIEQNYFAKISFDETIKDGSFANVVYINDDVKVGKNLIQTHDLIVVDPPRKGLDNEVLDELIKKTNGKLFYISCSFESFKKDILKLLENGWKIKKASGYLFFPGTEHIETFSVLEK